MTDDQRLALLRAIHTAIYVIMAASTFIVLYAGVTGAQGTWMWLALGLVSVEVVMFVGSGMKCPFTAAATRYGAKLGEDTFFPERITRHTLTFFSPIILAGILLLAARWVGLLH